MSETESTSAELRRAEQERDEAIRRLARFEQIEDDIAAWRDAAKFQHALDEAVTIATGELRAELASARQLVAVARAWRNGERSGVDLIAAIDAHDAGIVRRQATPTTVAADCTGCKAAS